MSFWIVILVVALGTACWWATRYVIRPARHLRRTLRALARGEPVAILSSARPAFLVGIGEDLRALAERLDDMDRQTRDEMASLHSILSSMSEGVMIVDSNQRIRLMNKALSNLFEQDPSPLNRPVMDVFRHHRLHRSLSKVLATGRPVAHGMDLEVRQNDAYITRAFQATLVPMKPSPGQDMLGVIVVLHDITELKKLEAVRREFVVNVSHELRTPLSIITGYLETLLEGALDDRETAEKFLRTMEKHSQRLNLLIEDLLTISRLESGVLPMRFEPVNLTGLLDSVYSQLEPRFVDKAAILERNLPTSLPRVQADPMRLEQVFYNLLDNALKYGNGGTLRIEVSGVETPDGVKISIADNGPGIPLSDQPHIFERFYRVHKDRSKETGGTGLGLSIVKHILLNHGGSVEVGGAPGKGCVFHLTLPRAPAEPVPAHPAPDALTMGGPKAGAAQKP